MFSQFSVGSYLVPLSTAGVSGMAIDACAKGDVLPIFIVTTAAIVNLAARRYFESASISHNLVIPTKKYWAGISALGLGLGVKITREICKAFSPLGFD